MSAESFKHSPVAVRRHSYKWAVTVIWYGLLLAGAALAAAGPAAYPFLAGAGCTLVGWQVGGVARDAWRRLRMGR